MPPATTDAFKEFLKSPQYVKMMTNQAVNRVLCEGITDFDSLCDFDKDSLKSLNKNCQTEIPKILADAAANIAAEPAVKGAFISMLSSIRLLTSCNAAKYYKLVCRTPTLSNMKYTGVLDKFQVDWDQYEKLKKQDKPVVPLVKEADSVKKIINWAPIFVDCMSRIFGLQGPLSYVLREIAEVPSETEDPLLDGDYFGASGGLIQELTARIPLTGALYKTDNKTLYLHLQAACKGTSVETTVNAKRYRQDGRAAYMALIDHHAGAEKYNAIMKTTMAQLQGLKWNGRACALEKHVSTHRRCYEELLNCVDHVPTMIPGETQRVTYLVDSIECSDGPINATVGIISADVKGMKHDFEKAASALMEIDPYVKGRSKGRGTATISSLEYTGRGGSGVDLRWHTPSEYRELSKEQKDELFTWQRSAAGKVVMNKSRKEHLKDKGKGKAIATETPKKRKKWVAKYIKTAKGRAHISSLVANLKDEDKMDVDAVTGNISSVSVEKVSTLTRRIESGWKPNDDLDTALELERQEDAEAFKKQTREDNESYFETVQSPDYQPIAPAIPHGLYTPVAMRKKKRELKRKAKVLARDLTVKKTELKTRLQNPEKTGLKSKMKSILKGPDTERAPGTNIVGFGEIPTTMTLQSIIENSFDTVN